MGGEGDEGEKMVGHGAAWANWGNGRRVVLGEVAYEGSGCRVFPTCCGARKIHMVRVMKRGQENPLRLDRYSYFSEGV